MAYKYNPLLPAGLDQVSAGGGGGTPGGADTQVQFNDGGAFGGDAGLTYNKTTDELTVAGDINLDDGGTFSTTVQSVTPTANRTISFPDATGTVALVAGSSGQVTYNNAGAQAGLTSANIGSTGEINISLAGAASTPPVSFTGSWFTGGTSTTTKPQLLIEPTGTTSTAWSTSGTGLGVNAASGFAGNLIDLQINGSSKALVDSSGEVIINGITPRSVPLSVNANANGSAAFYQPSTVSYTAVYFLNPNGVVGNIATSGSSTLYNTSSDYRLKENVVPLTGAADRVNQLQVHRFNFIADPDTTVDGFLAHEAQEIVPECVTGTKDEVDDEGNPVYQGIDQSKLVPLLTAALQEALAKIETLEQRLSDAGIA